MLRSMTSMSMTACLLVAPEGPRPSLQYRSPSRTSFMLVATLIRLDSGQVHLFPCTTSSQG